MEFINKQVLKNIVTLIAKFNRHDWFRGKDMEEWIPFIVSHLYKEGIYMMPVGMSWLTEVSKESVERYLDKNKELFNDYDWWCDSQRKL